MTSKIEVEPKRGRGRPTAFDRAEALEAAMLLFWERGYEGTTFDDLTTAMRINASSFRNSFKSKEALYRETIDAYVLETGQWFAGILFGEANVRTAFSRLLEETAALYTRELRPSGCMISLAATHVPPDLASLKALTASHRHAAETAMAERIQQGQRDGQVDAGVDRLALAAYFNTVFRGMAVQARDGASTSRLTDIARLAMTVFPA